MNIINKGIVGVVKIMPRRVVRIFAGRYIAGEMLQDAVRCVKELNAKGIFATIDLLGEAVKSKDEALKAKAECLEVLDTIKKFGLKSNLSIKPTQFGCQLDSEFGYKNVEEIVARAKEYDNFVRIDMEDATTTTTTFELLKRLRENFDNVGVVVQAYLKRTLDDVKSLNGHTNYRLCKGIYVEPEEIAYKERQKIRDNYIDLLRTMFFKGNYVGIATHDDDLVEKAKDMISEYNVLPEKYEFQMLLGVKEKLRDQNVKEGFKVRVYVPFGEHWYEYSIRRLSENPRLAWYIAKSIFSRS
jgi:proline dehydrogenase